MEGTNASEVREDDDAHRVMMHDGPGDDAAGGGGGEGCGGEDDGENNEEEGEKVLLEDLLRYVEHKLLLKVAKGLNNLEMLRKARKESLYEEAKGCEKKMVVATFYARHNDLED